MLADKIVGPWLDKELQRWRVEEQQEMDRWAKEKANPKKAQVDDSWKHWINKLAAPALKEKKASKL